MCTTYFFKRSKTVVHKLTLYFGLEKQFRISLLTIRADFIFKLEYCTNDSVLAILLNYIINRVAPGQAKSVFFGKSEKSPAKSVFWCQNDQKSVFLGRNKKNQILSVQMYEIP